MIDLSKPQYKMLCKIKTKKAIPKSSLSESELAICQYLFKQKCFITQTKTVAFGLTPQIETIELFPETIQLSQIGEAQIYAFRSTFYKWWIPVVVSILSLLISIAVPVIQSIL